MAYGESIGQLVSNFINATNVNPKETRSV